ncbi:MAG: hypothetical protein AB7G76_13565 [Steroidobacteraceae bacterium]
MRTPRTITIGARASALSQVQARLVGDALAAADPRAAIRYRFIDAAGDRDLGAPLPALLRAGGFTSELSQALGDAHIDLAVHSWKDLPFTEPATTRVAGTHLATTHIAATLGRADPRDLLLVRRDWLTTRALRVLSCSPRRATNLRDFLPWALPGGAARVYFQPVRGDILRRLRTLLGGEADALVVAKAAIDRLLTASGDLALARVAVRQALDACRVMVLPLAVNPAAPGQGALAIEVRRSRADLADRLAAINHAPTYARVMEERAPLAATRDEDHPFGVSIVPLEARTGGEAVFRRGALEGARIESAHLRGAGPALPPATRREQVWTGERAGSAALRRIALAPDATTLEGAHIGFLVARADALPEACDPGSEQTLWTAGLDTWRKLAARGHWVSGSDESLGETGALTARALFPQVTRWIKLTHAAGYDTPHAERMATYRLERIAPLEDLRGHTHFYWRSGAQFTEYLRAYPGLRSAWHGCGPGNTLAMIRAAIGPDRVRPFYSARQFLAETGPW